MKNLIYFCGLAVLLAVFNISLLAQDNPAKTEDFNKIAKLTKSKKDEDREKAFQLSKEFVNKYGKNAEDDQVKKIKMYLENYQLEVFDKKLNENKTAEAFTAGERILAEQPENSYVTFSLAYAGFDANLKTKTKEFNEKSVKYANDTLRLFEAGKLPKSFEPFKSQTEVTALMYYILGSMQAESDVKSAVSNFYKSVSYDAQFKEKAFPYSIIIFYYETEFNKGATEFNTKHGSKTVEDAAMKADQQKLEKLLANLLDAYSRAIKYGEAEKNPSVENWRKGFSQVYQMVNKSDAGAADYLLNQPNKPMPEPLVM